ncbi:hypothetical protein GCM10011529_19440 [Polymorphobacter glacialis]|uniref:DUF2497 domain-containing protein n=1 Tax=Sandarakinorhabdus glacialis TaxID=1614636 RepID=A0A917E8B3_9SPHN|nr:DUF2497 domain-containing protein [Polymorphobacter glacialis]GGE13178.1 hypothetical protein GCM10011529_19440 [Polymorphobacter glacialis]
MSDLPPNIDAILASIRSRMNDEGDFQPVHEETLPVLVQTAAPVPPADLGAVAIPGGMTLDTLMRSMLEPMLKDWLDANMPEIVERIAQAEIKRLTGKD